MKKIPLSQGKFALVDDEDFEKLNAFKWYARKHRKTYYAERHGINGSFKRTYLHHAIKMPEGENQIDHKDGNGLNNQKENLRECSHSQNICNQKRTKNKCGFKGIYFDKRRKYFNARVTINKKTYFVGCFKTPEQAASAYDEAAKKYHGEFASTNF